jgi:hypothetical protein
MDALLTFELGTPVETPGDPIAVVSVTKLPGVREFLQSGLPVGPDGEYDMPALSRLLADCSDAPEVAFSRMGAADLFSLSLAFARLLEGGTAPKLRPPTGADLIAAGSPVTADGKWSLRSLLRLGMALSGLEAEAIQALPGPDFLAMINGIAGFLAPSPAKR